ncbi:hypothetical protein GGI15_002723 [Coemansia interrupta]|uniref:SCP domain-containing protein n=1 Tax=Coemansia interrupta TaxID=1126814 RepID=A0A9W8HCB6_9FUNG|nr:hypothetical protein GGI15_002723 [Coemansia interrupta]
MMRMSALFLTLPLLGALALAGYIPDYVMVSPDHVALAPSGPQGLNANALNNMLCLTNRFRYDLGLSSLALDAQLIRYAQERAQELSYNKANITNNQVVGQIAPISFNTTYWADVSENLLQTTNNPTFAYWEIQQNEDMAANLASQDYMFFGAGLYNGYYVQAFGAPASSDNFNQNLFPACPANQTFYNWVYPNGMSSPPKDKSQLLNTAYPYDAIAKISPNYYIDRNPYYDNGRTNDTRYYFTPELGNVPFLKSLAVSDIVAGANTSTPYAATADSGEQGMTKDELNLMTCLINARRYKSCLPPVALNSQLIAAAQAHSYEMNVALNMSHYGASGWPGDRIKRRGFIFGSVGENVVANTHDVYGAHVTFSQSQGHLNNILGAGYTFIGAGRSGQFWTVEFANYLDKSISPDPASFPLCPGNETAIAIAFPDGLPAQPKLDATACGNTEATSVVAPPYIQSQYSLASVEATAQPTSSAAAGAGVAIVTSDFRSVTSTVDHTNGNIVHRYDID